MNRHPSSAREAILRFSMDRTESDRVTAHAGLPLVLEALRAVRLDEVIEQKLHLAKRRRGFPELAKVDALIAVIAAGGNRIEDIRILAEDKGLWRLLERTPPSPDSLIDFLNGFHDPSLWATRPKDELSWVPPESRPLIALDEINRALVARAADPKLMTATIDHDGTIIEAKKKGATVAYEGTRGYQPLLAVWAEQDLILADEFRDGNVPGNKDPLSSVCRAVRALPPWVARRYFRGDSAAYYTLLLKYLVDELIRFTISADMSPELRSVCEAVPKDEWKLFEKRPREVVDLADVEFTPGDWSKKAKPLRYVAMRFTPPQGELFSDGTKVDYLAVVSNRHDLSPKGLVRWHWKKAGTIEHSHRVLKDELGAGVLPSQQFGANAAWFRINVLTYNLLTYLRRRVLPERYQYARPKRLRFDLFNVPGRIAMPQGELTVSVSTSAERCDELVAAREQMALMREELVARPARAARGAPKRLRTKSPRRASAPRP